MDPLPHAPYFFPLPHPHESGMCDALTYPPGNLGFAGMGMDGKVPAWAQEQYMYMASENAHLEETPYPWGPSVPPYPLNPQASHFVPAFSPLLGGAVPQPATVQLHAPEALPPTFTARDAAAHTLNVDAPPFMPKPQSTQLPSAQLSGKPHTPKPPAKPNARNARRQKSAGLPGPTPAVSAAHVPLAPPSLPPPPQTRGPTSGGTHFFAPLVGLKKPPLPFGAKGAPHRPPLSGGPPSTVMSILQQTAPLGPRPRPAFVIPGPARGRAAKDATEF
jgi:hypothetical protein